jgi:hypothetical protein
MLPVAIAAWGQENAKPIASLEEGIRLVRAFKGKPEDFELVIPESLLDSAGLNIAIITNEILMRGWMPDTVTKRDGYRVFRYKKLDKNELMRNSQSNAGATDHAQPTAG